MLYSLEYELKLCEELKDVNVNSNTAVHKLHNVNRHKKHANICCMKYKVV